MKTKNIFKYSFIRENERNDKERIFHECCTHNSYTGKIVRNPEVRSEVEIV